LIIEKLDGVRLDLRATGPQKSRGRHAVAREEALHMRRWRIAWRASVDDRDSTPRPAEHQRGA
jgi:hypothetical protein